MLEYSSSKYHEKIPRNWFLLHRDVAFARALSCFVASTYTRAHRMHRKYFSAAKCENWKKNEAKRRFSCQNYWKIPRGFQNPTSHGAKCGTFPSKNTTRNRKFHENPTPRWDFLKSVSKALIILDRFRVFSAWFDWNKIKIGADNYQKRNSGLLVGYFEVFYKFFTQSWKFSAKTPVKKL